MAEIFLSSSFLEEEPHDIIVSEPWAVQMDWSYSGDFERYTGDAEFSSIPDSQQYEGNIVLTLKETNAGSKHANKVGSVFTWELQGELNESSRNLSLKEVSRNDPNSLFDTWMTTLILTFNEEWDEFTGIVKSDNGNEYTQADFAGKRNQY